MAALIKLTFALRAGKLVHVSEVESGRQADCLCPECHQPLIARKGAQRRHHFDHDVGSTCNLESAIHWVSKRLLFDRVQLNLARQQPLPIEWACQQCEDQHSGNLLRRATSASLEQTRGSVRPDILLCNAAGKPTTAVEIVLTHEPEAAALAYYAAECIHVVLCRLSAEADLDTLRGTAPLSVETTACLRPKCPDCKHPLGERDLHVVTGECYRCQRPMPMAFTLTGGEAFDPTTFTKAEIAAAERHGCRLRMHYSKTVQKSYLANECTHCGAFAGNFFLPQVWHLANDSNAVHRGKFCMECARGLDS